MNSTIISFPGLGINGFQIDRVAFTIFGRDVMWYGIIISLGIITGFLVALYHSKQENISTDDVFDYAIFTVIFAIIGARLYYVLTSLGLYVKDNFWDTLSSMVAIWEGGLAIYGGVIGGAITIFIVSKIKKIKFGKACDMIVPALIIGQVIGRWGNFFNAEAHGTVTSLPWRMGLQEIGSNITTYVHPTFLYESLWNLAGFIILSVFYKKKKYNGQITFMYFAWYGFGRMFIEQLRTDSLYIGSFRISQVVGLVTFLAAVVILIINAIKHKGDAPILVREEKERQRLDAEKTDGTNADTAKADLSKQKAEETETDEQKHETEESADEPNKDTEEIKTEVKPDTANETASYTDNHSGKEENSTSEDKDNGSDN